MAKEIKAPKAKAPAKSKGLSDLTSHSGKLYALKNGKLVTLQARVGRGGGHFWQEVTMTDKE